jgi:hypothetical protein
VDNTSIFTNDKKNDIKQLKLKLQNNGTWWAGLLESSGGKLELEKCFYYLLKWKWNKNGDPEPELITKQSTNNTTEDISLTENNANTVQLHQKEIYTSHKTLGTMKNMTGDESAHIKFMTEKSNKFEVATKHSQFNRRQSRMAYNSCYIPALLYSLTVVSITEKQTNEIQQKTQTKILKKCGYEMHFPIDIVYGPIQFGGLGFHHLYVASSCNKIQSLLSHVNGDTLLGKAMQLNLNWNQLIMGTTTPMLEENVEVGYMKPNSFVQISSFLRDTNAKIFIENLWKPEKKRINDIVIMDQVVQQTYKSAHQRIFNNWRMYFQINTLSDLASNTGDKIEEGYLNKNLAGNYEQNKSKLKWPIQQMPHLDTYKIWKTAITQIVKCNNLGHLQLKLGPWTVQPQKQAN